MTLALQKELRQISINLSDCDTRDIAHAIAQDFATRGHDFDDVYEEVLRVLESLRQNEEPHFEAA